MVHRAFPEHAVALFESAAVAYERVKVAWIALADDHVDEFAPLFSSFADLRSMSAGETMTRGRCLCVR